MKLITETTENIEVITEEKGSGTTGVNSTAVVLSGRGVWDLRTDGNEISNNATLEASTSPAGDILFSTRNFNNGDSYTIIVEVR